MDPPFWNAVPNNISHSLSHSLTLSLLLPGAWIRIPDFFSDTAEIPASRTRIIAGHGVLLPACHGVEHRKRPVFSRQRDLV